MGASTLITIVNEDDQPIGAATKREAWDKGLIHRVSRVMIEDGAGRVLLQHRSSSKDIYPNCWDNSAAGHVDAGEEYEAAARRELLEELGLKGLLLTKMGSYRSDETWKGHRLNRFTRCYRVVAKVKPTKLEAGKVDDARWFTLSDVKALVRDYPDQVSDGLRQVISLYY